MAKKNSGQVRKGITRILYHNTFLLVVSFLAAMVLWFSLAVQNTDRNLVVYDVPITVQLSENASADGVQVFRQSYTTADLELSGSNLITSRLSAEDFEVTALLNPSSTKLTGNTMQKDVIQVRAAKVNAVSDYNIVSVSPEEITVEYDRYKETVFPLEQALIFTADTGYYPGTPVLSTESVTVSGPESSVNKISRAAVNYTLGSPLRADASFTCAVKLYDQNNLEISDLVGLCLNLDVDTVSVEIPVLARKTVKIVAATLNQPKGFAENRITVDPATIDIAGSADALSSISEITLDTPIDFTTLDVSDKNVFTMDIPLPSGVRNIGTSGDSAVSQATVSVNLNDFKKVTVSVPSDNFSVINLPANRVVDFNTQQLDITVIGSEAQANRLTGDSVLVQLDLQNYADQTGTLEVPVTVTLAASGTDSCWTLGRYTLSLELKEPPPPEESSALDESASDDDAAASPQE